ncbi:hypothetical protein [Deinococcus roseus]|uniref:Uncharacterized protein n=1 Tax=Deinococcus roseus TaxID=392414 RepID=A0ABQ2D676_9DEIO|nr:hypothetical protein [Deinococcus roseus]GGJ42727.1 hypothetical protein GCM10008938_31110 [Deinococcus roseus]
MNLYPTFEQGLKAELPLLRLLTVLSIEVNPHRFGQMIVVHYLAPTGHVLKPQYQESQASFWIAGVQLTPRSVERVRRLTGLHKVTVSGLLPRSHGPEKTKHQDTGFSFQVAT